MDVKRIKQFFKMCMDVWKINHVTEMIMNVRNGVLEAE